METCDCQSILLSPMLEVESLLESHTRKPFFCAVGHADSQKTIDNEVNWLFRENLALLEKIREGIDSYVVAHLLNLINYSESLSSTLKESWKQSVVSSID